MLKSNITRIKNKNHQSNISNLYSYANRYANKNTIIIQNTAKDNNKHKNLYKYIQKDKHHTNKSISNNNIKTKKYRNIKDNENTLHQIHNKKNINYLHNANKTIINNNNGNSLDDANKINLRNKSNNIIYNNNFCERKTRNICYCFPDNKLRKIKGLSKDNIIKNFESKRISRLRSMKNKYINLSYFKFEKSNNNYLTYLSTIIKNNDNNRYELSTDRIRFNHKRNYFKTKDRKYYENSSSNYHTHLWIWFPIKLEKYIYRKTIINNGSFFINNLKKINNAKLSILRRIKLLFLLNNMKKKLLKISFRKYRENALIEKVKQIYEKRNLKLREKKRKNNLKNRARLFITKDNINIKTKNNKNKDNPLNDYKKSFERFKSIIYKYHIYNCFKILNNLLNSNDSLYNLKNLNPPNYSAKITRSKKHIKIKYIRKRSGQSMEKCNCSLSGKTSSSNISKSTHNTTKKMKVYKRTIFINNNENNNDEINDQVRKQFKLKMDNILFKLLSEQKKYFSKWKKIVF